MKKFVFSVASRATGRLQIKPSGSGDENEVGRSSKKVHACSLRFCALKFTGDVGLDFQEDPRYRESF